MRCSRAPPRMGRRTSSCPTPPTAASLGPTTRWPASRAARSASLPHSRSATRGHVRWTSHPRPPPPPPPPPRTRSPRAPPSRLLGSRRPTQHSAASRRRPKQAAWPSRGPRERRLGGSHTSPSATSRSCCCCPSTRGRAHRPALSLALALGPPQPRVAELPTHARPSSSAQDVRFEVRGGEEGGSVLSLGLAGRRMPLERELLWGEVEVGGGGGACDATGGELPCSPPLLPSRRARRPSFHPELAFRISRRPRPRRRAALLALRPQRRPARGARRPRQQHHRHRHQQQQQHLVITPSPRPRRAPLWPSSTPRRGATCSRPRRDAPLASIARRRSTRIAQHSTAQHSIA